MSNVPEQNENVDQDNQARSQVQLNDAQSVASYANFCRVVSTPEEIIFDFGLNSRPVGAAPRPIALSHRIVTNFYTAKRLLHALGMAIQRHEAAYGVIELDLHRRMYSLNQNLNQGQIQTETQTQDQNQ